MDDEEGSYEMLKNIDEMQNQYYDKPTNNLDSIVKIYSAEYQTYITCRHFNKRYLYLTSPRNYQVWEEFRDRSNIDDLLPTDDAKIDEEIALKLIQNMDITDDKTIQTLNIIPFLMRRTKDYLKRNILIDKNKYLSLPSLFGIMDHYHHNESKQDDDDILSLSKISKMKMIKYVSIENIDVIPKERIDDFMRYIFDEIDIPWIDDETKYNLHIVTLKHFYIPSVVIALNKRKDQYFMKNNIGYRNTSQYHLTTKTEYHPFAILNAKAIDLRNITK